MLVNGLFLSGDWFFLSSVGQGGLFVKAVVKRGKNRTKMLLILCLSCPVLSIFMSWLSLSFFFLSFSWLFIDR